jgi:hypothetical protein
MTAKQFLEGKTLTAVETVDSLILNLVIGEEVHGLEVDTSQIIGGTPLTRTNNFTITNDILTVDSLTLDLSLTDML